MENNARTVKHEAAPPQCSLPSRRCSHSEPQLLSHSHVENGAHPQALLHEDTEVLLGTHCNILWVAQDKGGALKRKTSFRCSRTEELELRRKYYEDEFSTWGLEHKWGRQADWLRRALILPSLLLSPWKGWVLSPPSLFINIRLSHLNVIC